MIEIIKDPDSQLVLEFLRRDYGVNYFIRLGLKQDKEVFQNIWLQSNPHPEVILLQRKSGNLQFFATDEADLTEFIEIIKTLKFKKIMADLDLIKKVSDFLPNLILTKNSFVATICLSNPIYVELADVKNLRPDDLPEVVELYKQLFQGFPTLNYLQQKLETKRGRGFILRNAQNEIISIIQTDFEENGKAIITGVGTATDYQRRGIAFKLMQHAHLILKRDGFSKLYLQYDDEKAGRLYKKLGYKIESRMGNLIKKNGGLN